MPRPTTATAPDNANIDCKLWSEMAGEARTRHGVREQEEESMEEGVLTLQTESVAGLCNNSCCCRRISRTESVWHALSLSRTRENRLRQLTPPSFPGPPRVSDRVRDCTQHHFTPSHASSSQTSFLPRSNCLVQYRGPRNSAQKPSNLGIIHNFYRLAHVTPICQVWGTG